VWIRSVWRCLQWQRWGSIDDLGSFGNSALGEGDAYQININGGDADWIDDEEEVVRRTRTGSVTLVVPTMATHQVGSGPTGGFHLVQPGSDQLAHLGPC
jgi:hypothetical protein